MRQEAINRLFKTAPSVDDDGVVDLDALQAGEEAKQDVAVPPEFQIFKLPEENPPGKLERLSSYLEEKYTDLFGSED